MPAARPVMPEPLELAPAAAAPAAGRARLLALALRLRELLTGHAGALGLIMSGPLDGPNAMRLNETLLESFMVAGLELDDAARAAYALQVYVLGSIALESADLDAESEAAEASDRAPGTEAAGATLWTDLATFPLSERTESVAAQHNSTAQFTWGVQRLLDGLIGVVLTPATASGAVTWRRRSPRSGRLVLARVPSARNVRGFGTLDTCCTCG